jgi:hypothetical protein
MTWGTRFNTEIYLLREKYSSKSDVDETIGELSNKINNIISKIKMFASASPSEIVPEDCNDEPINWINNEINELLIQYDELSLRHNNLLLYSEYLKENPEHNIKEDYDE